MIITRKKAVITIECGEREARCVAVALSSLADQTFRNIQGMNLAESANITETARQWNALGERWNDWAKQLFDLVGY